MDHDVRDIYYIGNHWRLVALSALIVLVLSFTPFNIFSNPNEISIEELLSNPTACDPLATKNVFDKIEFIYSDSEELRDQMYNFIQCILSQIETQYKIVLSIPDACEIIKQNLENLNISEENRNSLLLTINFVSSNSEEILTFFSDFPYCSLVDW